MQVAWSGFVDRVFWGLLVVIGGVVLIGVRIGWVRARLARCGGGLHCSAGTRRR